jgi:plasmid maintenance system antidote protein VapI
MYILKEGVLVKLNQTTACEVIGITQPTLSNILNRKVACRKVVAFSITKYLDENAEIEDYFEKKGE